MTERYGVHDDLAVEDGIAVLIDTDGTRYPADRMACCRFCQRGLHECTMQAHHSCPGRDWFEREVAS